MDVFIANEQEDIVLDEQRFVVLARAAMEEMGVDTSAELSVLLIDRGAMAELKERYLHEEGPTDVLVFPMDDDHSDEAPFLLGDIVICPDVAREQAEKAGSSIVDEMDLLFVHGFLHLLGYDHAKPQEAKDMRHRERKILQEFKRVTRDRRDDEPPDGESIGGGDLR
jgi:probable rRNA maturation factor